jgi:hypothetical protein
MQDFKIGAALSETWQIFTRNFPLVALISLLIAWLPPELIAGALGVGLDNLSDFQYYNLISAPFTIFASGLLITLGLAGADGAKPGWSILMSTVGDRWASYFGQSILGGLMTVLGLVLLIVPGFIAATFLFLSGPACIAEKRNAGDALSRSQALVKDYGWQIFGYMILLFLIYAGVIFLLLVVGGGLLGIYDADAYLTTDLTSTAKIFDYVTGALLAISSGGIYIGSAVAYRHIKVLKEGDVPTVADVFN